MQTKTVIEKLNNTVTQPDHDTVLLFLHIPKAAGTTLTNCIYNEYRDQEQWKAEGNWLIDGIYYYPARLLKPKNPEIAPEIRTALNRPDVKVVVGHFTFGIHQEVLKPCSYMTFIRDPVERVISLYSHIKRYRDTELHKEVVEKSLSIEQFTRDLECRETNNDQVRRIAGVNPPFGQCTKYDLELAMENLEKHFSVVGITERFDETLLLAKRKFRWVAPIYYLPSLVNSNRKRRTELSESTISAISELNSLDYELHKFAENLLNASIKNEGSDFQLELHRFQQENEKYMNRDSE
ncbi:sulfotransferase family 2 domain-containing protein [Haliea sp. E17]|uniref:sulfotransferase family 2 domain-containing protein n=1 Tax=Haliea sp. E17 TaxID=3401576 RepID=UPI003AAF61B4